MSYSPSLSFKPLKELESEQVVVEDLLPKEPLNMTNINESRPILSKEETLYDESSLLGGTETPIEPEFKSLKGTFGKSILNLIL